MFLKPIQWAWSLFVGLILLYVFFFVPIGRRTLFEHARRIAGTPEAQEFGHDVSSAGRQAVERARDEIQHEIAERDGAVLPSYHPASATPPSRAVSARADESDAATPRLRRRHSSDASAGP